MIKKVYVHFMAVPFMFYFRINMKFQNKFKEKMRFFNRLFE